MAGSWVFFRLYNRNIICRAPPVNVLGTQQAVDRVVRKMVMEPFDIADDSLQLESQVFRNFAAARIFRGAFDGEAIEFPGVEAMRDEGPAARRHDALSLVPRIKPIAQDRAAVQPVDAEVADHSAEPAVEPDAGVNRAVDGGLLLPDGDGFVHIAHRTQEVQLGLPAAQMPAVGIDEFE